MIVVTTILDPKEASKEDLACLYRERWNQELDLRSIKSTINMDVLRCKTPELVRKEIWTHILAYNLVRTIMAQAAYTYDIGPRTISFKGTLQTLEAFQPLISFRGHRGKQYRTEVYKALLDSIVLHVVADRPDRFEPRTKKRSHIRVAWMTKPRCELKRLMRQGVTEN